eukprot:Awhi_evm1s2155
MNVNRQAIASSRLQVQMDNKNARAHNDNNNQFPLSTEALVLMRKRLRKQRTNVSHSPIIPYTYLQLVNNNVNRTINSNSFSNKLAIVTPEMLIKAKNKIMNANLNPIKNRQTNSQLNKKNASVNNNMYNVNSFLVTPEVLIFARESLRKRRTNVIYKPFTPNLVNSNRAIDSTTEKLVTPDMLINAENKIKNANSIVLASPQMNPKNANNSNDIQLPPVTPEALILVSKRLRQQKVNVSIKPIVSYSVENNSAYSSVAKEIDDNKKNFDCQFHDEDDWSI